MNVLRTCERNIFWLGKCGQTKTQVRFPLNVADTTSNIPFYTDCMLEMVIQTMSATNTHVLKSWWRGSKKVMAKLCFRRRLKSWTIFSHNTAMC